jgi:hypothetical protein
MVDISTLDPLLSFDMDSSFWVCDNSATGHICNNKELFTDELVPSIYEIGSATGILMPTLMGTVTLRITDNEGAKHSFVLKNINYLPSSPVNILSLRRLAELYPDDAGHPDRTGTGIVLATIAILCIGTVRGSARHFIPLHLVFQNVFSVLVIRNWMYFPR